MGPLGEVPGHNLHAVMITYRCENRDCRIAGERLLPVVAEALRFECPECHRQLAADGEYPWSLTIASDARLWPDSIRQLPFFAAAEIERLRGLFKSGQTYGAILQLRDVLELLLKLPLLLGASRVLSQQDLAAGERDFLYALVEKALSLGDWHRISKLATSADVRMPAEIRRVIAEIKRLFDQNQVPQWRNDTIGHGALGFDTDVGLRADLEAKLLAVAGHLTLVAQSYSLIDVQVEASDHRISLRGVRDASLDGVSGALHAVIGAERWPLFPYIHLFEGGIFFFDAYQHYRLQNTALLSYTDGHKRRERLRRLAELYESLVLTMRLKVATTEFEPLVRTRDQEQVFLREWQPEDIVEPSVLEDWLRQALDDDKGLFVLQMERGCGKTTFCHHIDDLRRPRPAFDATAVRIHYGNDLYGYMPGNFTWSVTDSFRADRSSAKQMTGNIPFLSPVASDKKRALAQHLEFFLTQRRRLFGSRRIVLVIDAVDETPLQDDIPILDFIPAPEDLEPGIFIVVTARVDDELAPAVQRRIRELPASRRLVVRRDEPANRGLLEAYLRKTNTPEALWNYFLAISEQRFLYLRALISALSLFGARRPEELPRGSALTDALLDRLGRIYGRHSEHLYDIATIIAFSYEPLSVEEICFLVVERFPSLRTAAFLRDLSGVLRTDRSDRGNVFSVGHEEIGRALRERFAPRQEVLLRPWLDSLREGLGELLNEPSAGLDYLLAYAAHYAASINVELFTSDLADQFVSYACREEGSQGASGRRRRLMLLATFRWLDERDDAAAYLAAATKVSTRLLIEVLEQRLIENDATLQHLRLHPGVAQPPSQPFFRALAISSYETQSYASAIELTDRLYASTQSKSDLVNLALMLKGTDTSLDGAYTMARARIVAAQLLADAHSSDLSTGQRGYAFYTIGRIFGDTLEHLSEALPLLEESLRAFDSIGDETGSLAVRNSIAISFLDSGDFAKAASGVRDVVAVLQSRLTNFPKHMREAALINMYILSYLADAEVADPIDAAAIGRWEIRAYHLNNRFVVEYAKGNLAAAEAFASQCLDLTEAHKGVYSRAAILNNTGIAFERRSDIVMAHELCKASGYSIGEAITACNLGLVTEAPKGVLWMPSGLLWPCLKNFDMLLPAWQL